MVIYRAKKQSVTRTFTEVLKDEEHTRKFHFKHQFARTTLKQMGTSVVGVKLCNSLQNDLKGCINIFQFKKMYKERITRHV